MARRLYIVCYDIRSPKRWRRVFALMDRSGLHRQLSVFLVKKDRRGMERLINDLDGLIDPDEDTVVIAPVGRGEVDRITELGVKGAMPGAQVLIV